MINRLKRLTGAHRTLVLVFLALFSCVTVIACTAPTSGNGSDFPAELVFATEDDYPPFDFQQDGKHVGYNQDMLDAVVEGAPFKVKQEIVPWQGILAGVASGKYAASNAAASVLEERTKSVSFTMPTTELTNYYVIRKGESIKSIADFAGKNIGVQQGGATSIIFDEVIEPELAKSGKKVGNVAQYGAFAEAYQDLENKRLDIVVNNVVALSQLIKSKPDVFELGNQVGPTIYAGWTVNKNNTKLLEFLNSRIAELKANGKMKELQEKWLNISFDNLPDEPLLPGNVPIPAS